MEVTGWQLSPEMLALYQRFYAGETLTNDENSTLKKAIKDQWDVIRTKLSGKPYARFTQAWDVTYQPGTNGKGDGVTDVKFYGDASPSATSCLPAAATPRSVGPPLTAAKRSTISAVSIPPMRH